MIDPITKYLLEQLPPDNKVVTSTLKRQRGAIILGQDYEDKFMERGDDGYILILLPTNIIDASSYVNNTALKEPIGNKIGYVAMMISYGWPRKPSKMVFDGDYTPQQFDMAVKWYTQSRGSEQPMISYVKQTDTFKCDIAIEANYNDSDNKYQRYVGPRLYSLSNINGTKLLSSRVEFKATKFYHDYASYTTKGIKI
jgi:hypothetical protein